MGELGRKQLHLHFSLSAFVFLTIVFFYSKVKEEEPELLNYFLDIWNKKSVCFLFVLEQWLFYCPRVSSKITCNLHVPCTTHIKVLMSVV